MMMVKNNKECVEDCENCPMPYGEVPSSWGCRLKGFFPPYETRENIQKKGV